MIKTIIFDMGGVIITLDPNEALRRFAVSVSYTHLTLPTKA